MNRKTALPTFRLEPRTSIAQVNPWLTMPVTLDSPALEVMTDLTVVKAVTAHPATTLRQAELTMIYRGVRMLFVVSDTPAIEGLITSTDLHGDKQERVVHDRHLPPEALRVSDLMTGLAALDAVDHERMKMATVGDAIATLQHFGRNHLLVVQNATAGTPRRVRGVISRSQIERQLGVPVAVTPAGAKKIEREAA
jgi:CBS-domain-containing membrane protein